jgi:two-component system response regulator YesN
MKKTWHTRLLLSYVPMLFITISMLVFVSVSIISEITVNETKKANRIFTEYVADSMQSSLKSIERLILEEVNHNEAFSAFFEKTGGADQRLIDYMVSKEIGNLISDNPMIHSIYLYRASDKIILTKSLIEGIDDFQDQEFVRKMLSEPNNPNWSPVRKYSELKFDPKDNVISLTKKALLPFGNQGMIVINVKVDSLLRFVDETINHDISFLEIRSADHQKVYPLTEAADLGTDAKPQGKIITELHSDYLGWDFASGIKGGILFSWVPVISRIWIGIGIMTVLASLFYIIFVTRRNYKPIENIIRQINAYSKTQLKGGGSDEFAYIQKVLDNLYRENNIYEKKHKDDLPVKRKQAFLELVEGLGPADKQGWQTRLAEFNLACDFDKVIVAVVEIDRYESFKQSYPPRDQHLLKFALTNVAAEFFGTAIWEEWISGNRLAIVYMESTAAGDDGLAARFADKLDKFRVWVALNLKLSVTIGVGKTVSGPGGVPSSFEGALTALQYKMSLGSNQMICSEELDEVHSRDTHVYYQLFGAMLQDLRMGNAAFPNQLASFAQHLEQDVLPAEEIDHLLQYWIGMVQRSMEEAEPELADYWRTVVQPEVAAAMEKSETLEELLPVFVSAFERLYAKRLSLRESKSYHQVMKDIRAYIEDNYDNPDLSLNHISDKFSISGKYLSQLFKEHFGMKFVDFIVNLRMEHAKRLLLETDEPIQDIAVRVGYLHSISFGRTFKKIVGVTPGDFRKYRQPL